MTTKEEQQEEIRAERYHNERRRRADHTIRYNPEFAEDWMYEVVGNGEK